MRKTAYELLNIQLERIKDVADIAETAAVREKLSDIETKMRSVINEEYLMGSTNRRTCKTVRSNFVKNNPALLDAAKKIVDQEINVPLNITDLFDDKYLRVVITFVKDQLGDFRYFTYQVGNDRMLVKVSGTPLAEKGETFESTF